MLARPPPCCPGSAVAFPHGHRGALRSRRSLGGGHAGVRVSAQPSAAGAGPMVATSFLFLPKILKTRFPTPAARCRAAQSQCGAQGASQRHKRHGWGASGGVALAGPDPQLAQRTRARLCEAPALMNVSRCKPCPSRTRRSVSSNIRPQSCRVLAGRLCLAHAAQHASGRPARRTPSAGGWAARPAVLCLLLRLRRAVGWCRGPRRAVPPALQ